MGWGEDDKMTRLLGRVTLVSTVLFATVSARAAEVSPNSPYYNPYPTQPSGYVVPAGGWNGFYVGAIGAGAWAQSSHTDVSGLSTGDFSQNGYTIGITAGYNWQLANILFGFEGDVSFADIKGSTPTNCMTSCFTTLRMFDTARGRLGYVFGTWTPYVTGGAAFANIRAGIQSLDDPNSGTAVDGANNRVGATVGAGIEWLFLPSLSVKAEYLYTTFSSETTYINETPLPVSVSERNVNLVRAGVNYHFNY